jgi:Predicted glutamine amidotransferases
MNFSLQHPIESYVHKFAMLGISRGIQIIIVAMGRTVSHDIGLEANLTPIYMVDMSPENYSCLATLFSSRCILHTILGETIGPPRFYHRGLYRAVKHVTMSALAGDHAVDGIQITGGPSVIVGVQRLPEMTFKNLVQLKSVAHLHRFPYNKLLIK